MHTVKLPKDPEHGISVQKEDLNVFLPQNTYQKDVLHLYKENEFVCGRNRML